MFKDEGVAKGEKGVVEYYCGKCLTGVVPNAKICHSCGHQHIEKHVRGDYGPPIPELITEKFCKSPEHKLY